MSQLVAAVDKKSDTKPTEAGVRKEIYAILDEAQLSLAENMAANIASALFITLTAKDGTTFLRHLNFVCAGVEISLATFTAKLCNETNKTLAEIMADTTTRATILKQYARTNKIYQIIEQTLLCFGIKQPELFKAMRLAAKQQYSYTDTRDKAEHKLQSNCSDVTISVKKM